MAKRRHYCSVNSVAIFHPMIHPMIHPTIHQIGAGRLGRAAKANIVAIPHQTINQSNCVIIASGTPLPDDWKLPAHSGPIPPHHLIIKRLNL